MIIEAEVPIEDLFNIPVDEPSQHDEQFAFSRCLSRLKEMQTNEYQNKTLESFSKKKMSIEWVNDFWTYYRLEIIVEVTHYLFW